MRSAPRSRRGTCECGHRPLRPHAASTPQRGFRPAGILHRRSFPHRRYASCRNLRGLQKLQPEGPLPALRGNTSCKHSLAGGPYVSPKENPSPRLAHGQRRQHGRFRRL